MTTALLRDSSVLSATSPPRPSVLCSVAHCCHTVLLNSHYTRHIHTPYILFSLFVCTTYGAKQCGWLLSILIHTLFFLNAESLYLMAEPQIHCFLAITKIIANYNSAILCHIVSIVGDNTVFFFISPWNYTDIGKMWDQAGHQQIEINTNLAYVLLNSTKSQGQSLKIEMVESWTCLPLLASD